MLVFWLIMSTYNRTNLTKESKVVLWLREAQFIWILLVVRLIMTNYNRPVLTREGPKCCHGYGKPKVYLQIKCLGSSWRQYFVTFWYAELQSYRFIWSSYKIYCRRDKGHLFPFNSLFTKVWFTKCPEFSHHNACYIIINKHTLNKGVIVLSFMLHQVWG